MVFGPSLLAVHPGLPRIHELVDHRKQAPRKPKKCVPGAHYVHVARGRDRHLHVIWNGLTVPWFVKQRLEAGLYNRAGSHKDICLPGRLGLRNKCLPVAIDFFKTNLLPRERLRLFL